MFNRLKPNSSQKYSLKIMSTELGRVLTRNACKYVFYQQKGEKNSFVFTNFAIECTYLWLTLCDLRVIVPQNNDTIVIVLMEANLK